MNNLVVSKTSQKEGTWKSSISLPMCTSPWLGTSLLLKDEFLKQELARMKQELVKPDQCLEG